MDTHQKKMIAPIVITVLMILYYAAFFLVCLCFPIPLPLKLLFCIVPLLLAGVTVYVLRERMKEIRSGEEDDLSKY